MLTPEEVRELLLPFDPDYLIEHGIADDSDALEEGFYTDENGIYHYQRIMNKETFTPFSGLMIRFSEDDSDRIEGYSQMKEGYPLDDVEFYESGALYSYERWDDTERYLYTWHENGALKSVCVWHRRDKREYTRGKLYSRARAPYCFAAVESSEIVAVKAYRVGEAFLLGGVAEEVCKEICGVRLGAWNVAIALHIGLFAE